MGVLVALCFREEGSKPTRYLDRLTSKIEEVRGHKAILSPNVTVPVALVMKRSGDYVPSTTGVPMPNVIASPPDGGFTGRLLISETRDLPVRVEWNYLSDAHRIYHSTSEAIGGRACAKDNVARLCTSTNRGFAASKCAVVPEGIRRETTINTDYVC